MTLIAALVLDHGSDVPYAHLERQRVLRVHAAQPVHELDHVLHGAVRQALHAHEFAAARLREARDRTYLDSVKFSHPQPPCPAVRNRPRGGALPSGGLWQPCSFTGTRPGCYEQRIPCPGVPGAVSNRTNLLGPRALGALGDGVLYPLVVLEAAVAVGLDCGVVDENVGSAVVGGDEPVALVRIEPLYCSLSHCALLPRRSSGCTGCTSRALATARPSGAGPGNRRRPRSEFRGRCDTDTNFDCYQLHLTPCRFNATPRPVRARR